GPPSVSRNFGWMDWPRSDDTAPQGGVWSRLLIGDREPVSFVEDHSHQRQKQRLFHGPLRQAREGWALPGIQKLPGHSLGTRIVSGSLRVHDVHRASQLWGE